MMMQLNYAAGVSYFYSFLFEFVTYDMVPSDEIYGEIFDFDSDPYSQQADNIGYGSRYIIENTGSLFILLFVIGLRLLLLLATRKLTAHFDKFPKLGKWAKKRHKGFVWAGAIDLFSEMFLCTVFSLGINTSYFRFTSASETFNNLFMILLFGSVILVPPLISLMLERQLAAVSLG